MNFFQIISEIEKVDPEVYDRLDSRRSIFKNMAGLGQKLSAAAIPLAVGAIFNKVYAQTPVGAGINDVLNFALKLEYLESYFYNARTAVTGLSAANTSALGLIATDEANHVSFLRAVLQAMPSRFLLLPVCLISRQRAASIQRMLPLIWLWLNRWKIPACVLTKARLLW